jgi:sarcosine oxidase
LDEAGMLDVIVLGLGAMGSAATFQLSERGVRVLGLDQFDPPHHFGSSHGETRITRVACGEGVEYSAFARRSHEIWRQLEARTGAELLTQNGLAVITGTGPRALAHGNPDFLATTVQAAQGAGIEYQLFSGSEFRKRYPAYHVRDDDTVYFDRVGGFVRPERCIETQLALAKANGASIHTAEKVLHFEQAGAGVTVTTDRASYRAARLIVTAGPWLPQLLDPGQVAQPFEILRQVLYWFRVKGGDDALRLYQPDRFPVFVWQVPAAEMIYGFPALGRAEDGLKIATEQHVETTTPQTVDRTVSEPEIRAMYQTYVRPYFPGLEDVCVRSSVCLYTRVANARFIIDRHPRMDRVVVASPCSGHGFKHSAAIGEVLARMVMGEPHLDVSKFGFRA